MYKLNKIIFQNNNLEYFFYFLLYDYYTIEYGIVEEGSLKVKIYR
jgi:hypothetical protein